MIEVSHARFDELVGEALDQIPDELARRMDNVVVLVQEINQDEPGLLGLYEGVALTERGFDYAGMLPDRIVIYRRPLLTVCNSEEELVEEVLVTVVHEIAHHFGIDDRRLHDLGWG